MSTTSTTITCDELAQRVEGQTVATTFAATVARVPGRVALQTRNGDGWTSTTYAELADQVARVAAGLGELGVGPGDRVVLMMRNRAEFHVADLAVLNCGATPVSIYNSSSSSQVAYLAAHCSAKVAIVENDEYLVRFMERRSDLPALTTIVTIERGPETPDGIVDFADLLAHEPVDLAVSSTLAGQDDLATIIYTSGTTGSPKGVMLTHRNIVWTLESLRLAIDKDDMHWRVVSYLPMAHVAERMVSHYQMIAMGYEIYPCPVVADLATYLREVRPHMMFGVPRVYEKIQAGVMAAISADDDKLAQFNEGIAAAKPIVMRMARGEATEEDEATWQFLDGVAFAPIREMLGLDELVVAVTGAAPMSAELLSWFRAIGVPLSEIYGMSESSGPMTWAPFEIDPGTVGPTIPGQELRLGEDDEVLVRGGNVCVGYLNDPEKTAETLDADGWLHSGDIGRIDDKGYLRIIDRKKELIITAGGKNVSPANLEAALKDIPLVGQAFVVGDDKPFIAALVTLDPDVAPVWAERAGLPADLASLAVNPEVRARIEAELGTAMAEFNNAERVKKITILPDEWLPDSDLLTPTSKLKRRGIRERYREEIEAMYA